MTDIVKNWIGGVISAAASGAAGVLALNVIDPHDFNIANPGKMFTAAGLFAIVGVVNYLRQSPLPGVTEPKN